MEEKDLKDWMQHSKLEIQLPDFEDQVMDAIHEKQASEKSVWKNIRWSWFFFLVGLALGLVATTFFSAFEFEFLNVNQSKIVLLAFEIVVIFILATQFDRLIRVTFRK
jgi:hypothetical protein